MGQEPNDPDQGFGLGKRDGVGLLCLLGGLGVLWGILHLAFG